ncbi:MAG: ABC transporter permease [Anaerolineae bacterium]
MRSHRLLTAVFIVGPIVVAVLFTSLLVVLVGNQPGEVFETVWQGAFRNSNALASVVNFWIPLVMVSMGLIVTFTAGLWNIGVEGQMMMGAIFASWAAQALSLPHPIQIVVEIAAAGLGGALWAGLTGLLKTKLGVNEIFGGVGLNALANLLAIYLISGPWQPPEGGSAHSTPPFPDNSLLPPISAEFPVSLVALVLAFVSIIAVTLALRGTRWGLQLKATGKNSRSALLMGVPTTRSAVSALMVCGLLAGLAGSYRVLFTYESLRPLVSGGIGFLGLLVVLLAGIRALWTPFIAFAFAAIMAGSTRLRVSLQLDSSLAGVLQGTLVLLVLLSNGLRMRVVDWSDRRSAAQAAAVTEATPQGGSHE